MARRSATCEQQLLHAHGDRAAVIDPRRRDLSRRSSSARSSGRGVGPRGSRGLAAGCRSCTCRRCRWSVRFGRFPGGLVPGSWRPVRPPVRRGLRRPASEVRVRGCAARRGRRTGRPSRSSPPGTRRCPRGRKGACRTRPTGNPGSAAVGDEPDPWRSAQWHASSQVRHRRGRRPRPGVPPGRVGSRAGTSLVDPALSHTKLDHRIWSMLHAAVSRLRRAGREISASEGRISGGGASSPCPPGAGAVLPGWRGWRRGRRGRACRWSRSRRARSAHRQREHDRDIERDDDHRPRRVVRDQDEVDHETGAQA